MAPLTVLYRFVKYMIPQYLLLIRARFDEELQALISTLSTMIFSNGLKYENLKGTLTDKALTYISAQLLVISLCESLNKEMQKQGLDGVNYLGSEKQLESLTSSLKETLIKQIHQHTKKMD